MIKLKPSYQTSDGRCFATYEEAQKEEILSLAHTDQPPPEVRMDYLADFILKHADELRSILAPQIGRPAGSKNGTGKRRNRVAAAENAAIQDMKQ